MIHQTGKTTKHFIKEEIISLKQQALWQTAEWGAMYGEDDGEKNYAFQ